MADKPKSPKRGDKKINLSKLSPDEILSGLLATPPPPEKQAKKAQRKATRTPRGKRPKPEEAEGER